MPLLTPPRTVGKLPYYEDLYGTRNEDEDLEGPVDQCETESDSDEASSSEAATPTPTRAGKSFFKQYVKQGIPATKKASGIPGHGGTNFFKGRPPTYDTYTARATTYEIKPSVDRKHSLPKATSKKLTPRKHGLFSSKQGLESKELTKRADSRTSWQRLESSNDGFPTLDGDEELVLPGIENYDNFLKDRRIAHTPGSEGDAPKLPTPEAEAAVATGDKVSVTVQEDEGYQADEEEQQEGEAQVLPPKRRGRPPKNTVLHKPEVANSSSDGRHSTRAGERREEQRKEAERLAKRPRTRALASSLHELKPKASGRDKATARGATLHKKARKLVRGTRGAKAGSSAKGWKLDVSALKPGQGYVEVVSLDDAEVAEYEEMF